MFFCDLLKLDPSTTVNNCINLFEYLSSKVSLTKWNSRLSQLLFHESKLPEDLKNLEAKQILSTLNITPELALELLPLLSPQMPRYYSIASCPLIDPFKIDLLVSLNSFEVEGVLKYGLASSFLCLDVTIGATIHGFIHSAPHFRIPHNDSPIIMIGPGTGLAPFRAFIQERILKNQNKNWLFFGERNRASDFYFEQELIDDFGGKTSVLPTKESHASIKKEQAAVSKPVSKPVDATQGKK
jgi:sulfite reductase (NADPH) flavoprotein alpha-component